MAEKLDRVREDLEAVRAATGLSDGWGRRGVRNCLLFAGAGLAAAAWALVPHGLPPAAGTIAFLVPVADWLALCRLSASDRPPPGVDWREWRRALSVLWLAVPLAALALWCRQVALPPHQFAGLAAFCLGFALLSAAVGERGQRPLCGWAAGLMAGGLLLPIDAAAALPVLFACLAAGALASAGLVVALGRAR
jgi:hypothetical protein